MGDHRVPLLVALSVVKTTTDERGLVACGFVPIVDEVEIDAGIKSVSEVARAALAERAKVPVVGHGGERIPHPHHVNIADHYVVAQLQDLAEIVGLLVHHLVPFGVVGVLLVGCERYGLSCGIEADLRIESPIHP